jgi:uncharacterized membrane protein
LWTLLFIIPGIIKTYSYSLAPYLCERDKDLDPRDSITLSRKLMNGHKFELFMFELSFLGWEFLDMLTFGILGMLWLNPYYFQAKYNFLKDLIEED